MAGSFRIAEGYVEVTADETSFNRSMARLQSRRFIVNVGVQLDDSAAIARLQQLMRDRTTRLTADLDTRAAADDLALLTRARTTRITADADTGGARSDLDALTRDRRINVRVDLDRSALSGLSGIGGGGDGGAGIGALASRLTSLTSLAVGALPTIASLAQSIASMGPAASLAAPAVLSLATAFAAIKVGTSGIGDAFKAAFAPAVSSGSAATTSIRQVENAERSLAKAQQGVKDAEVRAAEARVQAARQIKDAQLNLKNTIQDVADSNRRAAQQVEKAERDLTEAQKEAKQAQEDLTQARKDAARQLEDLANDQKDAELDRRDAVLGVQDAQEELNKVLADPKATQQQREEAQLNYDQAVQNLSEIELRQKRLAEDAEAASKAGVEGSDQVKSAQERLADAQQSVIDKTSDLKDAQIEAARSQEDGAQRIARAERDLADAREASRKAAVDGARDIADAQAAVADAARALADAQTAGATAVNKLADAMAKLSPNAREFVNAVIAQGAAWRGLKLDVQDALFRDLGAAFVDLSTAVIPTLRAGLVGMADNLNAMAKNAAIAVIELSKTGTLKRMFDGLNEAFGNLNRIPAQFILGLSQLSVAASPAFARLTSAAGEAADRISQRINDAFTSGRLEQSIDGAVEIAKQFGKLAGDIFGTLGNIMHAAAQGGGDALGSLGAVFAELRRITAMPEVQQALASIFKAVNAIAKLLAGTLGAVIEAALPLLAALAPVVTELATKFAPVLADLASALGKALMPIVDALLPVVTDIGDVLVGLVEAVVPLLEPIGGLISAIVTALAPYLQVIGDELGIVVGALAEGLGPVIGALVPIVQAFGQFIGQLAPLFPPLLQALMPLIPPLAELAVSLLNLALQVITPLMPLIVGLAQLLTGVLAGAVGILVPVIQTVVGWLTAFTDAVTAAVEWVVDKFTWLYDVLVGHSIIPDLVKAIIDWFTQLWTKTKEIFTGLKNWVVDLWKNLWSSVRARWDSFWSGLKSAVSNSWRWVKDSVSGLKSAITSTWNGLWNGARDKISSIFTTIRSKISDFRAAMKTAFSTLRDSLGVIWNGVKSKIAAPVKFVIGTVYNNGIRKMWNSIAGKISSKITLPTISLGFNKGGVVPGTGSGDTVPAMLTPGERILSNQQVAQLGGHRGIDAMLGKDRPTRTGGNPTRQQERRRHQATQGFADGGIIGNVTSAIGGAVGSVASWAKDLVVGGLKAAAQKALSALVRPLINRIPSSGIGNLMRGLANKAVDGMMGWFGNEDKKAVGGPGVQKALSWARTQDGKPYQWGGNGNPSWDCSGLMSAIESVIRGEKPHRRWATGSFVGSSGPSGWVRNLNSPFMIGVTNAGVGHTAGTIGGVNAESRGGDGVIIGKGARGYNDPLFTSRWGFAPAAKFDSGGLLQPGATLAINKTRKPEAVLTAEEHEAFRAIVSGLGARGGITIEAINIHGTFDFSKPADQKRAAGQLVVAMKEALRQYDRGRDRG